MRNNINHKTKGKMNKIDIHDPVGTLYMTLRGVWLRKVGAVENSETPGDVFIRCVHDNGEYDGEIWIDPVDGQVIGAPSSKCGDLELTGEKKLPENPTPLDLSVRVTCPRVEIIFSELPRYSNDTLREMWMNAIHEVQDSIMKDSLPIILTLSAQMVESMFIYDLTNASIIEGGWLLEYKFRNSAG